MRRTSIIVGLSLLATVAITGHRAGQAQETWRMRLGDWQYPESSTTGGGGAGGGGTGVVNSFSSHFHAKMTTSDTLEDVVKYYEKKTSCNLHPDPYSSYGRTSDGMTNLFEDDSKGRPLTLRIFQQHTKTYSLSLVISRGEAEKKTHIYWTYVGH